MAKFLKKALAVVLAIILTVSGVAIGATKGDLGISADAATSLLDPSIYLKQPSGSTECTLYAATVLIRRTAVYLGV